MSEIVVPPDLVDALAKGECVLFAGSELSTKAGLPSRQQLLTHLLETTASRISLNTHSELNEALLEGALNVVADGLADALVSTELLPEFLTAAFAQVSRPSTVHQLLAALPITEVLTTSYDDVLEQAFPNLAANGVYVPENTDALLDAKSQKRGFILKIYGSTERPGSLILSPLQYKAALASNLPFSNFIQGLFFSRTFLFVGHTFREIQDFLEQFTYHDSSARHHYAFVAGSDSAMRARASLLERRFGLTIVGIEQPNDPMALEDFLFSLRDRLSSIHAAKLPPALTETAPGIRRLILEDIGSFERLELDFQRDHTWKILLGNNGVGKSTVLKAIAVAVIGSDARTYAGRLVRAGKTRGVITLFTERNPHGYVIEILTKDMLSEADVVCRPSRVMEAEDLLVLGFSPLRVVTFNASTGPQEIVQKGRPTSDDLIPLLSGEADPRMDRLKQWIVNLDAGDKPRQITSYVGHKGRVSAIELSSDGRTMISGGVDGTLRIWDSWTGREMRPAIKAHDAGVNGIALSGDGWTIATGSYDRTVNLWNLKTGNKIDHFSGPRSQVLCVALDRDACTVVAGTDGGSVRVWSNGRAEPVGANWPNDSVWSVALDAGRQVLYSAHQSGTIRCRSLEGAGEDLPPLRTGGSAVWSLAMDRSGTVLVAGCKDGSVTVFDLKHGGETVFCSRGPSSLAVAISDNGTAIASGREDGTVRVWDVAAGTELFSTRAHTTSIWSLALSLDGHSVVTGADDGSMKLWSIPRGDMPLATIRSFFGLLARLTDRPDIEFLRVSENYRVLVKTADTPEGVPLEVLSQGLVSLFSWVGVLCQRMKETSLQSDSNPLPTDGPAVVLIDELDAHMHPRWQQVLVPRLKEIFPNVQFIASTHSPLVVGGLDRAEVERFEIIEGTLQKVDFDADMTLGRTDQILTGELFSLPSTRDSVTQEMIDRYRKLLGISKRAEEEEKEFLKVQSLVESRVPPSSSNVMARRAHQLLDTMQQVRLDGIKEDDRNRIVEQMRSLSKAIVRGGDA